MGSFPTAYEPTRKLFSFPLRRPNQKVMRLSRRLTLTGLICLIGACGGGGVGDVLVASDGLANDGSNAAPTEPVGPDADPANESPTGQITPDNSVGLPPVYFAGETFRTNPAGGSVGADEDCQSRESAGRSGAERRNLLFDRATGRFFVNGGLVLDGGFTWSPVAEEFIAMRIVQVGSASGNYLARIDSTGRPTYYRYKLTLADGTFQQVECYGGVGT